MTGEIKYMYDVQGKWWNQEPHGLLTLSSGCIQPLRTVSLHVLAQLQHI